jgi:hypothetical protein
MKEREQGPCHPNLTEAEEQNYDINPSKIKEEENECQSSRRKQKGNEGSVKILLCRPSLLRDVNGPHPQNLFSMLRWPRPLDAAKLMIAKKVLRWVREAMVIMRTKGCSSRFRDALTCSALFFVLPAQETDRLQFSPPAVQGAPDIVIEAPLAKPSSLTTAKILGVSPVLSEKLSQPKGHAQPIPQPPCGNESAPPYPALDESAIVNSWSKADLGQDWKPPACTGWAALGFTTLVTTAARFRSTAKAEDLLRHIGAISELAGMCYWSTTHKQWQTLIVDAYALTDSQSRQRRKDFGPDEMKQGAMLYFEQVDNLSGKGIYRLQIVEASENRIVFDIDNVSTMRYLFIPILHPREIQSIYFLDRESDNVWSFYSIVRTGKNANRLIAGNESSAVNRAVAFYRHLVGIPTAQEPPAAR